MTDEQVFSLAEKQEHKTQYPGSIGLSSQLDAVDHV